MIRNGECDDHQSCHERHGNAGICSDGDRQSKELALSITEFHDDALVDKYNVFIFEVVKAHVARSPKHPETLHYTGDGVFMVSGKIIHRKSQFRPGML